MPDTAECWQAECSQMKCYNSRLTQALKRWMRNTTSMYHAVGIYATGPCPKAAVITQNPEYAATVVTPVRCWVYDHKYRYTSYRALCASIPHKAPAAVQRFLVLLPQGQTCCASQLMNGKPGPSTPARPQHRSSPRYGVQRRSQLPNCRQGLHKP